MKLPYSPWFNVKAIGCGALVVLSFGLASQLHAQVYTSYSTTFNNDAPGNTLDGQDGWTINDGNEPDSVAVNGSYSATNADYVAAVGGQNSAAPDLSPPTTSPVYLTHGFNPIGATYSFGVDFAVTNSTTAFPNVNQFAFTFQAVTTTGSTGGIANAGTTYNNLFSIDFVPNANTNATATKDQIEYSTYSSPTLGAQVKTQTSTGLFSTLNSRYHLSLSVNVANNTMQFAIYDQNLPGTVTNGPDYTSPVIALNMLNPGALINSISATYLNGGSVSSGSNGLFFDNFSAVPEPSTYAMLGLGLMGLVARFRRKARA